MPISFHSVDRDIPFSNDEQIAISRWIESVIQAESKANTYEIDYVFCSDEKLLAVNQEFLQHDFYTDIITFDNSLSEQEIIADCHISLDRITENAQEFGSSEKKELLRVLVHGILHLVGYNDKTDEEQAQMRKKEEHWIDRFSE